MQFEAWGLDRSLAVLAGSLLLGVLLIAFLPSRAARKWTIVVLTIMVLVNILFVATTIMSQLQPQVSLGIEEHQIEMLRISMSDELFGVTVKNPPMHMRGTKSYPLWFPAATNLLMCAALLIFSVRAALAKPPQAPAGGSGPTH
jgi:hypothetical protein